MASGYFYDSAFIAKEETEGVLPTVPKLIKLGGILNSSMVETETTETNVDLAAAGQGSKKSKGTSSYAGNLEAKIQGDMTPILLTHIFGEADTKTSDFNTGTWAAATVYDKFNPFVSLDDPTSGDIIKHTNNINTLVCIKSGTSGATIPSLVGKVVGDTITDGTVIWKLAKLKYRYKGGTKPCRPTLMMETVGKGGCSSPDYYKRRFEGIYMNSFAVQKQDGMVSYKYSVPLIASYATDEVRNTSFTSKIPVDTSTLQKIRSLSFGFSDIRIRFNDLAPVDATSFEMTLNRGTSYKNAVEENRKVSETPYLTCEGKIGIRFTKAEYLKAWSKDVFNIKALIGNDSGDLLHFTYPQVEKDGVEAPFTTSASAMLDIPMTAFGDAGTYTIMYDALSELDY